MQGYALMQLRRRHFVQGLLAGLPFLGSQRGTASESWKYLRGKGLSPELRGISVDKLVFDDFDLQNEHKPIPEITAPKWNPGEIRDRGVELKARSMGFTETVPTRGTGCYKFIPYQAGKTLDEHIGVESGVFIRTAFNQYYQIVGYYWEERESI